MRWLHLSDFHVGKDGYGQARLFKEILAHVRNRVESGMAPDFVFITGDLANHGKVDEYAEFYGNFLLELSSIVDASDEPRILVIPGNHDVDRTAAQLIEAHTVRRRAPQLFDPDAPGLSQRRNLLPRFEQFQNSDVTYPGVHWLASREGAFRFDRDSNGVRWRVVGINTAWLSENDHDRHQLSPGLPLVESLLDNAAGIDHTIVLGHHPTDWFVDDDQRMIDAVFSKHRVLYLHGHLHKSRARHSHAGAASYLAIQGGAAFQARDDDRWVNGFMWGEHRQGDTHLRIEPLVWAKDFRSWVVDGSAFPPEWASGESGVWHVPLPQPATPKELDGPVPARRTVPRVESSAEAITLSDGWQFIDLGFLETRRKPVPEAEMLRYFDGRIPRWATALDASVPHRDIVGDLKAAIQARLEEKRCSLTLLLGAGGEGKSTALLQTTARLVEEGCVDLVLWHYDEQAPLRTDDVLKLPASEKGWLVVSDDADLVARDVYRVAEAVAVSGRTDIHFLLTCRDTDWQAAEGETLPWSLVIERSTLVLRGMTESDARNIVNAWSRHGAQGLGRLARVSQEAAVEQLLRAAAEEAEGSDGAFLGAMLRTRVGPEMREHVRALLSRLRERAAPGGTLLDAFAYIVAAHEAGLVILSRPVLGEALGCATGDVRRKLLVPLGEEAAAIAAGQTILTRHKAIAETAIVLLEESFGYDREELLVELVTAANRAGRLGQFVPSLGDWEYLGGSFFDNGESVLGLRMAQAVVTQSPHNPFFRAHLGNLLRRADQFERAAEVFRDAGLTTNRHRGYFAEWSYVETQAGNPAVGAWLAIVSIGDRTEMRPPALNQVKIGIGALASSFTDLCSEFADTAFCNAARDAGVLLDNWQSSGSVDFMPDPGRDKAAYLATSLTRAAFAAHEQREFDLPTWVPGPDSLESTRLEAAIRRAVSHWR